MSSQDRAYLVRQYGKPGSNDATYRAVDLAGANVGTTNADGLLVIGSEAVVGTLPPGVRLPNSAIQNGPDAVAIYQGTLADFTNGTPVHADGLIDALVYDTADADDAELLVTLLGTGPEAVQVDEAEAGDATTDSIARVGDARLDGRAFAPGVPTPALPNVAR